MASDSILKLEDPPQPSDPSLSRTLSSSRLNARAAEFVPRSADPVPFMYHKAPANGFFHGQGHVRVPGQNQRGFTQHYVPVVQYQQQQALQQIVQNASTKKSGGDGSKSEITEEATQKVINQVYFSTVMLNFIYVLINIRYGSLMLIL